MKITDNYLKPSHAYHKMIPFIVSEVEWDTKEGPSKSIKNVLYVLQCAKKEHLEAKWRWTVKNQAHNLSYYQVTLVWRHQAVIS